MRARSIAGCIEGITGQKRHKQSMYKVRGQSIFTHAQGNEGKTNKEAMEQMMIWMMVEPKKHQKMLGYIHQGM